VAISRSELGHLWPEMVFHAAPLHYLPAILWTGELLASQVGRLRGIEPRRTAKRRDRMLNIDGYVHCALSLMTPLLRHKLARGMPHVVFTFARDELLQNEPCALLPCNTKTWRMRAGLQPVVEPSEISGLLRAIDSRTVSSSVELLVRWRLPMHRCRRIICFRESDAAQTQRLIDTFGVHAPPLMRCDRLAPRELMTCSPDYATYVDRCLRDRLVLPIPRLEFD
jgi:hypothetical protein